MLRRVLLVDDEAAMRSALKRQLRATEYEVLVAGSGKEALDILAATEVQVVVSDVRMPEMTGDVLMTRIKHQYPEVVGILLTGYAELNAVIRVLNEGAVFRFLQKPWEPEALLDCLHDAFVCWQEKQQVNDQHTYLENHEHALLETDAEGRTLYVNQKAVRLLNINEDISGAPLEAVLPMLRPEQLLYLASGEQRQLEVQDKTNGQMLRVSSQALHSERRMFRVEKLFELDTLAIPELLSRQELLYQLDRLLLSSGEPVTAIYLDINGFRRFNDSLGYQQADRLLAMIAAELLKAKPEGASLGRMSGDEFALFIAGGFSLADICGQLEAMLLPFHDLIHFAGRELHVAFRVGYARSPVDGQDADELLRNAQVAANTASRGGRRTVVCYQQHMNTHDSEFVSLQSDLYRSLERDQLFVLYQPKVSMPDGRIAGAEALIRWEHGTRGVISPSVFIPMAEENGLIDPIGDWVLAAASAQKRIWEAQQVPDFVLSVNLSGRQLEDDALLDRVRDLIQQNALHASQIELEITETFLMQDISHSLELLRGLKALGVRLAIDDFGTGYSSLNYLHQLPVDTLKIDRSFVTGLGQNHEAFELVKNIIHLSHDMGKRVVAEGVETREQLDILTGLQCDEIQGFFFSPPVSADSFRELLENQPLIMLDVTTEGAVPARI
ncbi:EAL domain-containing protein [Aliamphritea hakodatensis]|uniref:EAL domain-containing protein n=1 Tax=Aliamphritea hakodatensis TaxID=2895352 RepID=UPI0022FD8EF6|nr:EAL domain-containing protein [Aliamphritea hakodatensis]